MPGILSEGPEALPECAVGNLTAIPMFFRILKDSLVRQKRKKAAIFASITLGTSIVGAMLNISLDIGDRIREELRAYGANILVTPQGDNLPVQIGGVDLSDLRGAQYLDEKDLRRVKDEMFWRNNIAGFAPFLPVRAQVRGMRTTVVGTWFEQSLNLSGGAPLKVDVRDVAPYWKIHGEPPTSADAQGALVGISLARRLGAKTGDAVEIVHADKHASLQIRGLLETGGAEDDQIFVHLALAQELAGLPGKVKNVLVSALTTPEDTLFQKGYTSQKQLTPEEIERYACTPYITNVALDLEGALAHSVASPLRQVAQTEGKTYRKLVMLMVLVTLAALLSTSMAVTGAMMAIVVDRRKEIGLLKAIGADNPDIFRLLMVEALVVGVIGGAAGYLLGSVMSWKIGALVFSHPIGPKGAAGPLIVALACAMTLMGGLLPIRRAVRLNPAVVLKEA